MWMLQELGGVQRSVSSPKHLHRSPFQCLHVGRVASAQAALRQSVQEGGRCLRSASKSCEVHQAEKKHQAETNPRKTRQKHPQKAPGRNALTKHPLISPLISPPDFTHPPLATRWRSTWSESIFPTDSRAGVNFSGADVGTEVQTQVSTQQHIGASKQHVA